MAVSALNVAQSALASPNRKSDIMVATPARKHVHRCNLLGGDGYKALDDARCASRVEENEEGDTVTPTRVVFGRINENNVEMLRIVNCAIFPVRYSDSFYADILLTPPGYTKFAYVDGCAVGAICCRLEPIDSPSNPHAQRTYIMTLGILEPYRRCGLASRLLNSVVMQSRQDGIDHVYLHVQTSNSAALRFYQRFGFQVTDMIKNYYRRIEPPDCYVLTKALT